MGSKDIVLKEAVPRRELFDNRSAVLRYCIVDRRLHRPLRSVESEKRRYADETVSLSMQSSMEYETRSLKTGTTICPPHPSCPHCREESTTIRRNSRTFCSVLSNDIDALETARLRLSHGDEFQKRTLVASFEVQQASSIPLQRRMYLRRRLGEPRIDRYSGVCWLHEGARQELQF